MRPHQYTYKVEQPDGSYKEYSDFAKTNNVSLSFKGSSGDHATDHKSQSKADLKITKKIDVSGWSESDINAIKTGKPGQLLFDTPSIKGGAIKVIGIILSFSPSALLMTIFILAILELSPIAIIIGVTIALLILVVLSIVFAILSAEDYKLSKEYL